MKSTTRESYSSEVSSILQETSGQQTHELKEMNNKSFCLSSWES